MAAPAPVLASITPEQVWAWLAEVADPEIPVISIVDLGIVRAVTLADGHCTVTLTPTYSGCPAMAVIAGAVTAALREHGMRQVTLHTALAPAWTTDWISEDGKARLRGYGIAPPCPGAYAYAGAHAVETAAHQIIDISRLPGGRARLSAAPVVACPQCASPRTEVLSQFGSTPCKALYRCLACREPFDYFKHH